MKRIKMSWVVGVIVLFAAAMTFLSGPDEEQKERQQPMKVTDDCPDCTTSATEKAAQDNPD